MAKNPRPGLRNRKKNGGLLDAALQFGHCLIFLVKAIHLPRGSKKLGGKTTDVRVTGSEGTALRGGGVRGEFGNAGL